MQIAQFAKFPLIQAPTPLQRLRRFEQALGIEHPRVYIKRDDLTGLAFGGNKARKLEYLIGDAKEKEATVVVTEGPAQSNHARMTAAAAAMAGLRCVLVLDTRRGSEVQGNLLLDYLAGAEVRLGSDKNFRQEMMASIGEELRQQGERPYLIETGGSNPTGAMGYVEFALELETQLFAIGETPSRLYFPTGSKGTHAGLATGARAVSPSWTPWAIAVEGSADEMAIGAAVLATGTSQRAGLPFSFSPADMQVDDGHIGAGYGEPTQEGLNAITLLAGTEGIFLDVVYSAKAMSGLIADSRSGALGEDESVVFLHTGGGPSLFAYQAELNAHLDASQPMRLG